MPRRYKSQTIKSKSRPSHKLSSPSPYMANDSSQVIRKIYSSLDSRHNYISASNKSSNAYRRDVEYTHHSSSTPLLTMHPGKFQTWITYTVHNKINVGTVSCLEIRPFRKNDWDSGFDSSRLIFTAPLVMPDSY